MTPRQRRYLHGGPSVAVEPHPVRRALTGREAGRPLGWYCGDCGAPLVYGRDGRYRHRAQ